MNTENERNYNYSEDNDEIESLSNEQEKTFKDFDLGKKLEFLPTKKLRKKWYETSFSYEGIDQSIEYLREMWIDNGYREEYVSPDGKKYASPFEMIDDQKERVKDLNEKERARYEYIVEVFESTLLRNGGYRYGLELSQNDPERYFEFLEKNSRDYFWSTPEGQRQLRLYNKRESYEKDSSLSNDLAKEIINRYIEYDTYGTGYEFHKEHYKNAADSYLSNHLYNNLEYWSNEDNVIKLFRYYEAGGADSEEILELYHNSYQNIKEEGFDIQSISHTDPEIKEEEFDDFKSTWEIFKMPGIIQGEYEEFRKGVVEKLYNPSEIELFFRMMSCKERKYPLVHFLDKVSTLRENSDELVSDVAKKFFENLLLDPDLYLLVDVVRMFERDQKVVKKVKEIEAKELMKRRLEIGDDIREKIKFWEEDEDKVEAREEKRSNREKKLLDSIKEVTIGITYNELVEMAFKSPQFYEEKWVRSGGLRVLREIYHNSPNLYLDLAAEYLTEYVNLDNQDLSEEERKEREDGLRMIIESMFSIDVRSLNRELYDEYSTIKEEREKEIEDSNFLIKFGKKLIGKYHYDLRIEENLKYYKDTSAWVKYFREREHMYDVLSKLCVKDQKLFLYVMDNFLDSCNKKNDYNYFDGVRTLNIYYEKMRLRKENEEKNGGPQTVKDPIGGDREEIERMILQDAEKLCTPPTINITVNSKYRNPENRDELLTKYLEAYNYYVLNSKLGLDGLEIVNSDNGIDIAIRDITAEEGLITALEALDIELEFNNGNVSLVNFEYEKLLKRITGILVTPTIYEWHEDDKKNVNEKNARLRTDFFLPSELNIEYSDDVKDLWKLTKEQNIHFKFHYLSWYKEAKIVMGDVDSFNTVISAWLDGLVETKEDIREAKRDYLRRLENVWKDTIEALKVTYEYERFNRVEMFERFIKDTAIEQLVGMIDENPKGDIKLAMLSASILRSVLLRAKEKEVYEGVKKSSITLRKHFEEFVPEMSVKDIKIERVERALKSLGFKETKDGLEMFRNVWENLRYLRWKRGKGQSFLLTADGIQIYNPQRNMYPATIDKKAVDGNITKIVTREQDGGAEEETISWERIVNEAGEIEFDYAPIGDVVLRVLNEYSTWFRKTTPEVYNEYREKAAANIIVKSKFSGEKMFEIFAVPEAKQFWRTLYKYGELMLKEEGAEDMLELLKLLNET
jgi:hypothetical protein